MNKAFMQICLYLALVAGSATGQTHKLVEVGPAYSQTSVNTTIFRNNSLVTHADTQFVAYYDADGYVVLGKRALGASQWQLHRTQYQGNVSDAHNVISIMVDGDGYLHVAFDHHDNPLNYCRSTAPGALTLGDKQPMTGTDEQRVTYPEFYRFANGNLLFAYRSGSSGRGNLVLNTYDTQTRQWTRLHDALIDGEGRRSAYWQIFVDARGTIHLSWVWRETWMVETNHDMCYAASADGGKTWHKTTGEPYTLPIRADNAEYACRIPQNSELINQTGMTADAKGRPYIVTYWRNADSDVPQYRMIWHDGSRWQNAAVTNRTQPFTLKGGHTKMIPVARPRIVADKGRAWIVFRDAERGSKVSVASTKNLKKGRWTIADVTDFGVDAWEPSIDTELWKQRKALHIFVQETHQAEGEKALDTEPTTVYVLEY